MIRRNLMGAVKRAISSIFSWDFSRIGYTSENTTLLQQFEDAIAYSEEKARTFTPSKATSHFKSDKRLMFAPMVDTSNVKNMYYMFSNCSALTTIPQLDTSNVTNMNNMFNACSALVYCLIKNIGKSSLTTYDFRGATKWGTGGEENRQSLIDSLITYSYDRASNGMETATIKLPSTTKALLTAEEIAQIEAKGFTIA